MSAMKFFATISAPLINQKIHVCCPYIKQRQTGIKEVEEELKKAKDYEWLPSGWPVKLELDMDSLGQELSCSGYGQRRSGVFWSCPARLSGGGNRADAQFLWIALSSSIPLPAVILSTEFPPFKNIPFLSLSTLTACHRSSQFIISFCLILLMKPCSLPNPITRRNKEGPRGRCRNQGDCHSIL